MHSIAVIGAGQLGSRHLQGLIRVELDCQYFVVDPSPQSLATARARVEEVGLSDRADKVAYLTDLAQLPASIDYAVVATAADIRLSVLQQLLPGRTVRNMLLEKVLFQKVSDYQSATDLLQAAAVSTWVNCPRRAFPIYKRAREFFAGQPLLHFQVHGGNWGLGCNSIHFLDLLAFLTDGVPSFLSTAGLDRTPIPSKRANFYEFQGSLRGACGTAQFELTSLSGSGMPLIVVMRSQEKVCLVDEAGGRAFFYDRNAGGAIEQPGFTCPFVSEQSATIARDILLNGQSELTHFEDSVACHLPLIQALGAHAAEALATPPDYCPIT